MMRFDINHPVPDDAVAEGLYTLQAVPDVPPRTPATKRKSETLEHDSDEEDNTPAVKVKVLGACVCVAYLLVSSVC